MLQFFKLMGGDSDNDACGNGGDDDDDNDDDIDVGRMIYKTSKAEIAATVVHR